jgi:hypothetical protein
MATAATSASTSQGAELSENLYKAVVVGDVAEVRDLLAVRGAADAYLQLPLTSSAALPIVHSACAALQESIRACTDDRIAASLAVLACVCQHSDLCREVHRSTGRTALHAVIAATAPALTARADVQQGTATDGTRIVLEAMVNHLANQRRRDRVNAQLTAIDQNLSQSVDLQVQPHKFVSVECAMDRFGVPPPNVTSIAELSFADSDFMELYDDKAAALLVLLRTAADSGTEPPTVTCVKRGNVEALDSILSVAMPILGHALREQKAPFACSPETLLVCPPPVSLQRLTQRDASVRANLVSTMDLTAALPLNVLHVAALSGHARMARYLLSRSATDSASFGGWIRVDPNAHDLSRVEGGTALHIAASAGYADVVQTLLSGADLACDPSNRDRLGRTALHVAAEGPTRRSSSVPQVRPTRDPADNVAVLKLLLQWHEDSQPDPVAAESQHLTLCAGNQGESDPVLSPSRQKLVESQALAARERRRIHGRHLLATVDRGGRSALDAALRVGNTSNIAFLMQATKTLEAAATHAATATVRNALGTSATASSAPDLASHMVDASIVPQSTSRSTVFSHEESSRISERSRPATDREKAAQMLQAALVASSNPSELWRSHKAMVMRQSADSSRH